MPCNLQDTLPGPTLWTSPAGKCCVFSCRWNFSSFLSFFSKAAYLLGSSTSSVLWLFCNTVFAFNDNSYHLLNSSLRESLALSLRPWPQGQMIRFWNLKMLHANCSFLGSLYISLPLFPHPFNEANKSTSCTVWCGNWIDNIYKVLFLAVRKPC